MKETLPTIQFTYDKEVDCYCFGFWLNGKFIVRGQSSNKEEVWERFCEELNRLENS